MRGELLVFLVITEDDRARYEKEARDEIIGGLPYWGRGDQARRCRARSSFKAQKELGA